MDDFSLSPLGLFVQAGPRRQGGDGRAVGRLDLVLAADRRILVRPVAIVARPGRAKSGEVAPLLAPIDDGRAGSGASGLGRNRLRKPPARRRQDDPRQPRSADAGRGRPANLAVISSVSPFVGLFGTVWGIMGSFAGIAAAKDTSLAVVAPGIAEALAATAYGLAAAIPAAIGYNRLVAAFSRLGQIVTSPPTSP